MKKIPLRWIFTGGVIYLTLMAFIWLVLLFPQTLKIRDLKLKLNSDTTKTAEVEKEKEIAVLRNTLQETGLTLEKRRSIPEKFVLTQVLNTAQKARVSVLSVVPFSKNDAATDSAGEASLDVTFTGSYRQIVDFVHFLESDRVLFRIEKLTLENIENVHHGEVYIVTYSK